jgi:hypothetical protein
MIVRFKTLHLLPICARILHVRGTNTGSVEKWATPTFLLVKNVSSQKDGGKWGYPTLRFIEKILKNLDGARIA